MRKAVGCNEGSDGKQAEEKCVTAAAFLLARWWSCLANPHAAGARGH